MWGDDEIALGLWQRKTPQIFRWPCAMAAAAVAVVVVVGPKRWVGGGGGGREGRGKGSKRAFSPQAAPHHRRCWDPAAVGSFPTRPSRVADDTCGGRGQQLKAQYVSGYAALRLRRRVQPAKSRHE